MVTEVNLGGKSTIGSCMNCSRRATAKFFGVELKMAQCEPCLSRGISVESVHMVAEFDKTVRKCDDCFIRRISSLQKFSSFTNSDSEPFTGYKPQSVAEPPRKPKPVTLPSNAPVTRVAAHIPLDLDHQVEKVMDKCGCGKPKTHMGMCKVRYAKRLDNERIAREIGVSSKVTVVSPKQVSVSSRQPLVPRNQQSVSVSPHISTLRELRDGLVAKRDAIQVKINSVEKVIEIFETEE
jgi:hypothetical protein